VLDKIIQLGRLSESHPDGGGKAFVHCLRPEHQDVKCPNRARHYDANSTVSTDA